MNTNQKGFATLVALLAALCLAAIGIGTYFYVSQTAKPKPAPAAQKSSGKPAKVASTTQDAANTAESQQAAISTPAAAVDISDWQTYRNEEWGIEFKYPKTLIVEYPNQKGSKFVLKDYFLNHSKIIDPQREMIIGEALAASVCIPFHESELSVARFSDIDSNVAATAVFSHYNNYKIKDYFNIDCGETRGCVYRDIWRMLQDGVCFEISLERNEAAFNFDNGKIPQMFINIIDSLEMLDGGIGGSSSNPAETVDRFIGWYIRSGAEQCRLGEYEYVDNLFAYCLSGLSSVTENFVKSISEAKAYDPIVIGQDIARGDLKIQPKTIFIKGDKAIVEIANWLKIELIREGNIWKIDKIESGRREADLVG